MCVILPAFACVELQTHY